MKVWRIAAVLFAALFLLTVLYGHLNDVTRRSNPQAVQGVLDLTGWDFEKNGVVNLDGEWEFFREKRDRRMALEMSLFGGLLIMAFYHFGLFAFRREEKSILYFGLFCLCISIRALLLGETFLTEVFPNCGWETALKVKYLTFYLALPLIVMFLESLFPQEFPKIIITITWAASLGFGSLVALTPGRIFTHTHMAYQIFTIVITAFLLYSIILAIARKREGAALVCAGGLALAFTVINDILFFNELNATGVITPFGMLIFVLAHSVVLAMRFSKTSSKVEELSTRLPALDKLTEVDLRLQTAERPAQGLSTEELENLNCQLQELNWNLEQKVAERTAALDLSNRRLENMNEELSRMENSRRHLLTNISHDLKTPMTSIQGYVEAILDGVIDGEELQKKYLKLIHDKILGLNRLTQELFELTRLESRQVNLQLRKIPVDRLIRQIYEKYALDVEAAGLTLELDIPGGAAQLKGVKPGAPGGDDGFPAVKVDPDLMDRVFVNLIFNAIKFTRQGGKITIGCLIPDLLKGGVYNGEPGFDKPVSVKLSGSEVLIRVKDNGMGIPPEDLPYVFDRFYKGSKSRKSTGSSSGLGLAITKEIIEYHGGRIWVESKVHKGSTFCFTLPVSFRQT